jgi:hypothetical protein
MAEERNYILLANAIKLHSNDELPKQEGMVYRIFSDGEVTIQKSGSLLGYRSEHVAHPALSKTSPNFTVDPWPHVGYSGIGYAWVTADGAEEIRKHIAACMIEMITFKLSC